MHYNEFDRFQHCLAVPWRIKFFAWAIVLIREFLATISDFNEDVGMKKESNLKRIDS